MRRKNSKAAIIPLKGINTSTPDNTVEDGACEVLHNMRIKDGAWRNVDGLEWIGAVNAQPVEVDGERQMISEVLYKHPSASEASYIVISYSEGHQSRGIISYDIVAKEATHTFYYGEFEKVSIMHLGRLLILNIDGKMYYWRNAENSGAYRATSLPEAPAISLPEKIITSRPTPYIHTKGVKGEVLNELGNKTYLTPFPYYGYRVISNAGWDVYFPIYNEQGVFMQPAVKDDWWWGEICFFAAYKTKDGHYLRPSALNIVASELDNAGERTDLIMPYKEGLRYSYGVYNDTIQETGIVDGKMQMQTGTMQGQGSINWGWVNRSNSELIGAYDTATTGPGKSIGIFGSSGPNIPYSARILANALMIAPVCNVAFEAADPELFDSVVIFSTRIHPRWSAEGLQEMWDSLRDNGEHIDGESYAYEKLFADNKLPEQPFYKVLEIPRSKWGEGSVASVDVALTGSLLENAEQKEVWEPINPHELIYSSGKEINSMMHIYGDVRQKLYEGFGARGFLRGGALMCNPQFPVATSLRIDEKDYCVVNRCGLDLLDSSNRKNIVSYPDYRAREIYNGSAWSMKNCYELTSAIANNYAYYTADIFESESNSSALKYYTDYSEVGDKKTYWCKFPHRWKDTNVYIDGERVPIGIAYMDESQYGGNSISSLSELRVSALSNPLIFPLSRTYQIGSEENRIVAINSAAIELSDEKIGEYPTWVFTTEGVFVGHWGEGDDVIYRAFLPRTYDRICNPNTLAVNDSILFITQQGLMSIDERGSRLLSSSLNDKWGNVPQWLVEANILGLKHDTNEVLISGAQSDIYVLNLGVGVWSTRTAPLRPISKQLNNEILVSGESQTLYSIQREGDFSSGGGIVKILTRPIKLGEYEMKRIETLIARVSAQYKLPFTITIYGSVDGVQYGVLRQVFAPSRSPIRITRLPMSVRYFKIGIEFANSCSMEFTSFDIEYFNRFINRLR